MIYIYDLYIILINWTIFWTGQDGTNEIGLGQDIEILWDTVPPHHCLINVVEM